MYNNIYDDYIRSILGYPTRNSYNNMMSYSNQANDYYNNASNMVNNTVDNSELEECYPDIYRIVYPMVLKRTSNIEIQLSNEEIENMTDEIYNALEEDGNSIQLNINLGNDVRSSQSNSSKSSDIKPEIKISESSEKRTETRQINRTLRDLIKILLIRELLNRPRRRPRPPFFPGNRPNNQRPLFRQNYPFRTVENSFNSDFDINNYDIYEV